MSGGDSVGRQGGTGEPSDVVAAKYPVLITQKRTKLFPHMLPLPCLLQYGLMPAIEIHMLRSVSVYTLVQGF